MDLRSQEFRSYPSQWNRCPYNTEDSPWHRDYRSGLDQAGRSGAGALLQAILMRGKCSHAHFLTVFGCLRHGEGSFPTPLLSLTSKINEIDKVNTPSRLFKASIAPLFTPGLSLRSYWH